MKKVLLVVLSLLFATLNMQAQEKSKDDEVKIVLVKEDNSDNYYYEGVVPIEGISKEEMFKRAKDWALSTFKTEDNNSQFDEKELSIFNSPTIVLGKYKSYSGDYVNFKIKLMFKDGKYKFRFDNIMIKSAVFPLDPVRPYNDKKIFPGIGVGKYNKSVIENININFLQMTTSLENAMKGTSPKKSDW